MKNYRIITAPNILNGISILGWLVIAVVSLVLFDITLIFSNVMIAIAVTLPTVLVLYGIILLKSKINPDFIMIKLILFIKIKSTINAGNFKGNCYVS
ncbi:hypothetical protein [Sulfurimonas sp.]|uniref:hypothetical protein n=1 Tax=Sulfurimonas sp. TaxID=2022749 RepID=UPI002B48BF92|nr:hypothetical protein [Sulfurimonas sp.]